MLIYFNISPEELSSIDGALLEERISQLVRAHQRGRHLVTFSRRSASWISQSHIVLGERDASTFKMIVADTVQNGRLHKEAFCFIAIYPPGAVIASVSANEICLPLDYPNFDQVLTKPVLVLENINNDVRVVKFLLSKAPSAICPLKASFEPAHAGGSQGIDVSRSYINESRIVLLILDSDRKTPRCPDTTYARIKRFADEISWPLFSFNVWPCAELENLFTTRVLEHLRTPDSEKCLNHLNEMHLLDHSNFTIDHEQYQFYFDLKAGISPGKFNQISNPISADWLRDKFAKVNLDISTSLIPGLGENLVSQVFSSPLALSEFHKVIRSPSWLRVFGGILRQIMWTFAANNPQIT